MIVFPGGSTVEDGLATIEFSVAVSTFNVAVLDCPPNEAVMVVLPEDELKALPMVLTAATPGFEEFQLTSSVMS